MDNLIINVIVLVLFIIGVITLSLVLNKIPTFIRFVVMISILLFAAFINKVLLHFYRDYFVDQWYYSSNYNWNNGFGENIVNPFLFIGAIIYSVIQLISFKHKSKVK